MLQDGSAAEDEDDTPAGVVSFVPHSANKYPKAKKAKTVSDSESKKEKGKRDKPKVPQAARTLVKAGELVHVATDVPLTAQHDMFGAVDTSSFQVRSRPCCCMTCLEQLILRHFRCGLFLVAEETPVTTVCACGF